MSIPSLKNLDAAQDLCSTFLLWPLIDLEALASGQEICFNLVHSSNYEGIASKLTQFVQHFSSQSSFPPLFFEPFHRISWILNAENYDIGIFFNSPRFEKSFNPVLSPGFLYQLV